ncbi:MAG: BsuPI-related putative proteinase inhibitor [Panacagrimonas sp.]
MNRTFLSVLAVIVLSACSDSGGDADSGTAELCGNFSSTLTINDRMEQAVSVFGPLDAITFEARVTNDSTSPQILTARTTCPEVSFEVRNNKGENVWISDENNGRFCQEVRTEVAFAPGETKTIRAEWNQVLRDSTRAPSGQYLVNSLDKTECRSSIEKTGDFRLQ